MRKLTAAQADRRFRIRQHIFNDPAYLHSYCVEKPLLHKGRKPKGA